MIFWVIFSTEKFFLGIGAHRYSKVHTYQAIEEYEKKYQFIILQITWLMKSLAWINTNRAMLLDKIIEEDLLKDKRVTCGQ